MSTTLLLARHGRLREVNFGLWEGLTSSEINERYRMRSTLIRVYNCALVELVITDAEFVLQPV